MVAGERYEHRHELGDVEIDFFIVDYLSTIGQAKIAYVFFSISGICEVKGFVEVEVGECGNEYVVVAIDCHHKILNTFFSSDFYDCVSEINTIFDIIHVGKFEIGRVRRFESDCLLGIVRIVRIIGIVGIIGVVNAFLLAGTVGGVENIFGSGDVCRYILIYDACVE